MPNLRIRLFNGRWSEIFCVILSYIAAAIMVNCQ